MRLGEDPSKLLEPLPKPTAADILGFSTLTTPIENGISATIEYYKQLSSQTRKNALEFYER